MWERDSAYPKHAFNNTTKIDLNCNHQTFSNACPGDRQAVVNWSMKYENTGGEN